MLDPKLTEKLAKCFSDAVPPGMRDLYKDMEKNFHAILQSFFAKLDLVTREEFDAQKRVLERTRMKVTEMEKILREKNLMPDAPSSATSSPSPETPLNKSRKNAAEKGKE